MVTFTISSVGTKLNLQRRCPNCGRNNGNIHTATLKRRISDTRIDFIIQRRMKCPCSIQPIPAVNGGSNSEWLHCNGHISLGSLGGSLTTTSVTTGTTTTACSTNTTASSTSTTRATAITNGGSAVVLPGSWVSGTSHTKESGTNRALIYNEHAESNSSTVKQQVYLKKCKFF